MTRSSRIFAWRERRETWRKSQVGNRRSWQRGSTYGARSVNASCCHGYFMASRYLHRPTGYSKGDNIAMTSSEQRKGARWRPASAVRRAGKLGDRMRVQCLLRGYVDSIDTRFAGTGMRPFSLRCFATCSLPWLRGLLFGRIAGLSLGSVPLHTDQIPQSRRSCCSSCLARVLERPAR